MSEPMKQIEQLAKALADTRDELKERLQTLRDEQEDLRRRRMKGIENALAKFTAAHDELLQSVEAHPELFEKPKTQTFHAIRVGWVKGRGRLVIADAARTVELIEKRMPDRLDQLVKTTRSPIAAAIQQLSGAELKSIGASVVDGNDSPFVKPVDDEIDKLVKALLRSDDGAARAEAALA
ncbi:MAG TPA: hypothetical protein VLF18_08550 [Tahibacter sp.]|uniref:hypothetical protein n=1 Tax=Tahibacter sp. TaxID=2056211 RepID=UPI002C97B9AC|nr:hypothetical protein [Tahibacter sp.]HSX60233.1 hypothetical protein [Tahibacter sp.]